MSNVTHSQGTEALQTTTVNSFSISSGWDDSVAQMSTPPGMDETYIRERIHTPSDTLKSIVEDIRISDEGPESILAVGLEDNSEILEMELQPTSQLNWDLIKTVNPIVSRHIKGLEKSFSKGDAIFTGVFDGRYLRISYAIPGGDTIDIVFDVSSNSTSKGNGIEILNMTQTKDGDAALNMKSLMPGDTKLFYHKNHWLMRLISPPFNTRLAETNGQSIRIKDGFFSLSESLFDRGASPIEALAHEGKHMRDLATKEHEGKKYMVFNAFKMSLQLGNFISAALAIGISPWMLLPQFMIHVGSYFRSRSTENALGKGAHDLYVLEANASISSALISDFFRRKGFKVGKMDSIDNTVMAFNTNYRYAYQPLSWGIMDRIREDNSSDNREKRLVRSLAMQRVGI